MFERITNLFSREKPQPEQPEHPPQGESRFAGERNLISGPSAAGIYLSPETALQISAFFSAVHAIATDLATPQLDVYKRLPNKNIDYVWNHAVDTIFNFSPDDETNPVIWRQTLLAHALLYGGGYAEIVRRGNGEIASLHLLDPRTTRFKLVNGKPFYEIDKGKYLPTSDVLHISNLSLNAKHGLCISDLMRTTLGLSYAADLFGASFFRNGARPAGILKYDPQKVTFKDEAAVKRFRAGIEDRHSGAGNAGGIMLIEEGMEWIRDTITPDEAQFLETRLYQIKEVVRMFRVPPHKLGDYSESHYNNIESSNRDYYLTTLKPWATIIEKEINLKLFKPSERKQLFVKFDLQSFLEPIPKDITTHRRTLFECGIITRNEFREAEGYNSLGPEGDTFHLSKQLYDSKSAPMNE